MTTSALILVLSAAVLHAGWNLVVKQSSDRLATTWAIACAGAIVNIPVLVIAGFPEPEARPWLALSAVLHVAYGFALAGAYDRIDLSAAYPIARGTAPLIVAIAGVLLLGDSIAAPALFGIVLVTLSLGLIGIRHVPSGVEWALLTGVTIAAYTLTDGAGVRAGDESVRYIALLFPLHAALFTIALVVSRRSVRAMVKTLRFSWRQFLAGGAASAGAYLLVMIAARTTPLGLVAGLRETSAGFGVLAGALVLHEHVSRQHAVAVVVALAGAILIAVA